MFSKTHLPAVVLAGGLLIAGGALAFSLNLNVRTQVLAQFNESQLLLARQAALHVESYFDARAEDLRHLASLASLRQLDPKTMPADVEITFDRLKTAYVTQVAVLDGAGRILYATAGGAARLGAGADLEAWAAQPANKGAARFVAERSDAPAASPAGNGLELRTARFFLVTPLYRELRAGGGRGPGEAFAGLLLLEFDLERLAEATLSLTPAEKTRLQIWAIDADGTLLLHSEHPEMVLRNVRATNGACRQCHLSFDHVERMLKAKQGTVEYRVIGQPSKVAAFAPMTFGSASWIVVVNASTDEVAGFLRTNALQTFGLFGAVGLVAGATVLSAYRRSRQEAIDAERLKHLQEEGRLIEQLRENETRLRGITDSARDAIVVMDPRGNIAYWSPAAERLFGYTAAEAMGRDLHETIVPERYLEAYRAAFSDFLRTGRGAAIDATLEVEACRKDGREISVELSLSAFHVREGWHGVWIVRDITERKQAELALRESEDKYRTMVEHTVQGMFQTTPDGRFVSANDAMAEILGYADRKELLGIGQPIAGSMYVEEDRRAEFIRRLNADGGVQHFEAKMRRKDGRVIWTSESARVIRDRAGQIVLYEGFLEDITSRKESDQVRSDFVSFATHQLRTPLSGIRWLLELAEQDEGLPEEAASLVADARYVGRAPHHARQRPAGRLAHRRADGSPCSRSRWICPA